MRKAKIRMRSNAETGVDCSATKVIGVDGSCINMNPSGLTNHMPAEFQPAWTPLAQVISTVAGVSGPVACFGDFKGSAYQSNDDLGSDLCNTIPVESDGTFGTIGLFVSQLPCGKPTDMAFCVSFDKCGTFAIAFNAGLPICISTIVGSTTGIIAAIGAAASLVEDSVPNFSIGFSVGRRFTTDIRLAYRSGNSVHSDTVTTYGHLFVDIGLALPIPDNIKIGSKNLTEILSVSADVLALVDFGDVDTVVNSAINTIKNLTNISSVKTELLKMLKSGPEVTISITGVVTIGLQDLTMGILSDLSFTVAGVNFLATGGSGRSKLEAGLYLRIGSDAVSDLINSIQGIFDSYSDVFAKLGIPTYTIPTTGIELGVFMTTSSLGFQVTFFGVVLKCILIYSGPKFSCQINAKFFTMIADALQFVFKEAMEMFDETGKEIKRIAQQTFKEASALISKGVKEMTGFVKNESKQLISIGSDAYNELKNIWDEKNRLWKSGIKNAKKIASKVLSAVTKLASKKLEIFNCNLKLSKKSRKKCKRAVNEKYDKSDEVDTCPDYEFSYTAETSDKDIYSITSHTMDCPDGKALTYVKLDKNDSNGNIKFRYKCVDVIEMGTCRDARTSLSNPPGSSLSFSIQSLAGLNADCNDNEALTYLKYGTRTVNGVNNLKLDYKCCIVAENHSVKCAIEESQNFSIMDSSSHAIAGRAVSPVNGYLNSFALNTLGSDELNFTYNVCRYKNTGLKIPKDSGCDENGDGNIFYLNRHEVSCDNSSAISLIHLNEDNGNIHYKYECVPSTSISSECKTYYTTTNDVANDHKKSLMYLNRHNVACPSDSVMTYFTTEEPVNDKFRYKYTCCKASLSSCTERKTSSQDGEPRKAYYLEKIPIDPPGFEVIQRFEFHSSGDSIWYEYDSCKFSS